MSFGLYSHLTAFDKLKDYFFFFFFCVWIFLTCKARGHVARAEDLSISSRQRGTSTFSPGALHRLVSAFDQTSGTLARPHPAIPRVLCPNLTPQGPKQRYPKSELHIAAPAFPHSPPPQILGGGGGGGRKGQCCTCLHICFL